MPFSQTSRSVGINPRPTKFQKILLGASGKNETVLARANECSQAIRVIHAFIFVIFAENEGCRFNISKSKFLFRNP